jgi:acyl carrier protein
MEKRPMTVQERVLDVLHREVHRDVTLEQLDTPFEELGMDSLDKVCLLFGLEEEFKISIPESEAGDFSTVRQVIEKLTEKTETV